MKTILSLALQSLRGRALTASMTVLSIALSVGLLLGLEKVRTGTRASFAGTISGTDLVVGARSGPLQLLLYTVFHIGAPTANVDYDTYLKYRDHPDVKWAVPLSLGDSHRGYRVIGTTQDYFRHYRYRAGNQLEFAEGGPPEDLFDATIGAEIARKLGYKIGRKLVLAHGISAQGIRDHGDRPFVVTGVLESTGTPVDRGIFVSLEGIAAMHVDWQSGVPAPKSERLSIEEVRATDLATEEVTAFLVGARKRLLSLRLQREINTDESEPLLAVLPGVVLAEFWRTIGYGERALLIVSAMVVVVGLIGMFMALYSTLEERRREIAVLRALGARPRDVLFLFLFEAMVLVIAGILLGAALAYGGLLAFRPLLEQASGIYVPVPPPGMLEWIYMGAVLVAGVLAGALPAWKAYRNTLSDGLRTRM